MCINTLWCPGQWRKVFVILSVCVVFAMFARGVWTHAARWSLRTRVCVPRRRGRAGVSGTALACPVSLDWMGFFLGSESWQLLQLLVSGCVMVVMTTTSLLLALLYSSCVQICSALKKDGILYFWTYQTLPALTWTRFFQLYGLKKSF